MSAVSKKGHYDDCQSFFGGLYFLEVRSKFLLLAVVFSRIF